MKFLKNSTESWEEFGERCIEGSYGVKDGEQIANKDVDVSPERTISKARQLGEYLEDMGQDTPTNLEVFDAMNELRKEKNHAG